jgi:hypothetical protein
MRHRQRPGRASFAASVGIHALVVMFAWRAEVSSPRISEFVTYQIEIVSPPPAREAETPAAVPEEELVVETPDPLPPPEEPEPDPVVEERRVREEEKPEPTPTPPPPRPEEEEAGDPEPEPEESGENLSVRMEGLRRDLPDYYLNIIRQINRCMRFNGPGGLKTTVYFVLKRDGTVDGSDIDFVARSGNAGFDFAVMEAVECAGAGRFGGLPEELAWDRLPVVFEVTSSRRTPDPNPSRPRP